MGLFSNLIQHLGGIVTRRVDSALYNWMLAVSNGADGTGGTTAEVMYVSKSGSDTTGDGSILNPFLTIQAALTAIPTASLASTTPFVISVGPGIFSSPFVLRPWTFVVGSGRRSTIINNASANWIGAEFAGAVAADCGLLEVGFVTSAVTVNYADAAILSTGISRFFLYDVAFDAIGTNITGNSANNFLMGQDWETLTTGGSHLWNNINSHLDGIFTRATNITYSNNAAYALNNIRWGTINVAGGTLTISCASAANFLSVLCGSALVPNSLVLTGDGVSLRSPSGRIGYTGPDADTTFRFDVGGAAGASVLIQGGDNYIEANPTVQRTYTITSPSFTGVSKVTITNRSAVAIIVAFSGTGETVQTYVAAGSSLELMWLGAVWGVVAPQVQRGNTTLTNGVSPVISADITATSVITATLKTKNAGNNGNLITAKSADRVVGTRQAGTGSFKLTAVDLTGATVATDQSVYDWQVSG